MPNWCYNDIKFYSDDKSKMEYFHRFLEKWLFNHTIFPKASPNWYGKALYGAGIISDKDQEVGFPCRGFADDITDVDKIKEKSYFSLTTHTAWSPMNQIWCEVLNSLNLRDVKFAVFSEEPGMEIYEIYDPDDLFFSEKEVYVDAYGSEDIEELMEYRSKSELIPELQKLLNTEESDFNKLCELVGEYVEKKEKEGEEDIYLSIHEIKRLNEPY